MTTLRKPKHLRGVRRTFMKKGACSHMMFYILNQEFNNERPKEELATDPLAGGIMQQGYQCGMTWGASMSVSLEAYKRATPEKATGLAIKATQRIMDSFEKRSGHIDCYDLVDTDFKKKAGLAKYMIKGGPIKCFNLAAKWAPEAARDAREYLEKEHNDIPEGCLSCASEVAKKMGATDEQAAMVAGLAGGMGLSGRGCGALSAAIWMKTLKLNEKTPGKSNYLSPEGQQIIDTFIPAANYEFECEKIIERKFKSPEDHTEFIKNGGCKELIETLAAS